MSASSSKRPLGGGRVGGHERAAGAGGQDDDAAFFQVPAGAAADVGLGHAVHADGRRSAAYRSPATPARLASARPLITVASMPM